MSWREQATPGREHAYAQQAACWAQGQSQLPPLQAPPCPALARPHPGDPGCSWGMQVFQQLLLSPPNPGPAGCGLGTHLAVFSLPEVRWQLTKPKEVPLNMKETPTAPLFPARQRGGLGTQLGSGGNGSQYCPTAHTGAWGEQGWGWGRIQPRLPALPRARGKQRQVRAGIHCPGPGQHCPCRLQGGAPAGYRDDAAASRLRVWRHGSSHQRSPGHAPPCQPISGLGLVLSADVPSVLAMPVFTLEVLMWLMRFSCSGFTRTTILMYHKDCIAICGGQPHGVTVPLSKDPQGNLS